MLITQDYAAVVDNWNKVLESFSVSSATDIVKAPAGEADSVEE